MDNLAILEIDRLSDSTIAYFRYTLSMNGTDQAFESNMNFADSAISEDVITTAIQVRLSSIDVPQVSSLDAGIQDTDDPPGDT